MGVLDNLTTEFVWSTRRFFSSLIFLILLLFAVTWVSLRNFYMFVAARMCICDCLSSTRNLTRSKWNGHGLVNSTKMPKRKWAIIENLTEDDVKCNMGIFLCPGEANNKNKKGKTFYAFILNYSKLFYFFFTHTCLFLNNYTLFFTLSGHV